MSNFFSRLLWLAVTPLIWLGVSVCKLFGVDTDG